MLPWISPYLKQWVQKFYMTLKEDNKCYLICLFSVFISFKNILFLFCVMADLTMLEIVYLLIKKIKRKWDEEKIKGNKKSIATKRKRKRKKEFDEMEKEG